MSRNAVAALLAIATCAMARAAPLEPPLQYEGISAATTLGDLERRFPGQVDRMADDPTQPKRPVSATIRFAVGHLLGRASYLDYYEIAGEQRVIRLIFAIPGSNHPGDEINPSCRTLLGPLRKSYGRESTIDKFAEENFRHIKHIWTRVNQTMALDCGHLPREPVTIDRLYFECRGACR